MVIELSKETQLLKTYIRLLHMTSYNSSKFVEL